MFAKNAALTIVHFRERIKRKKFDLLSPPLREWKNQSLNKLKLYDNYIIKKAEIAPIR